MGFYEKQNISLTSRVQACLIFVAVIFLVLALRLWYLQIVKGDFFRAQSENNRLRNIYIPPPRGLILDRNGEELVRNRSAYNVELVVEDSPNPDSTVRSLAKIIGLPEESLLESLKDQKKRRAFEPKILLRDVSRDIVAKIAANKYELPGVLINPVSTREYVYGSTASHVLGYIREISKSQLDNSSFVGYRSGDMVGQFGIEQQWEKVLQGRRGIQIIVVNALGFRIGDSSFEPERVGVPELIGSSVTLTLDLDVQRAADQALEGKRGAIVALNPNTGEVLALASAPSFDPNEFARGIDGEAWQKLTSGSERALTNRATQGAYHPGSVFKIFMSLAGLAEGPRFMSTSERVFCPGSMQVGSRRFRCHKHAGHGAVNHTEAMEQSCDVWFYEIGLRLGVDKIHEYSTRVGLGEKTGLNLGDEVSGLIPSTEWKKRAFKKKEDQKWYLGETPSVSIGQGAVTTTPIQIARSVAAVINGGQVLKPWLVKKLESADGNMLDDDFGPEKIRGLDVDPKLLNVVMKDLEAVVSGPKGTGKKSSIYEEYGVHVAGKTGTAQVVALEHGSKTGEFADHAWFVGYAAADKPEIVVVALIENGGGGGSAAAPLVKKVLQAYYYKYGNR
jgi:penicillin-binding protein 2